MEKREKRNLHTSTWNKNLRIKVFKGLSAFFGLMFRIPDKNTIYILDLGKTTKCSIHTFFCLSNLDIYLLNENKEVIDVYKNVGVFKIIFPKKEFRYVVETRPNLLKLEKGDKFQYFP